MIFDNLGKKEKVTVADINRKDRKAWKELYAFYYAPLCAYVAKLLNVSETVEDIVQEVFIAVWEGARTFVDDKELVNYLYRACYNNTLIYIRNNQIHDSVLESLAFEADGDAEHEDAFYELTLKEEVIRQLYFHIKELPKEQRRIILLRIEGYTWEDIAVRLNVSVNTVKTHKKRSYKFLRDRMRNASFSFLLPLLLV